MKPIIEKFREEYLAKCNEIPLFNKKKRLEELQELYEFYKDKGDKKMALQVIREFREEAERRVDNINFNFTSINHTEFNDMSDEDLKREKLKTLEQLESVKRLKLLLPGKET